LEKKANLTWRKRFSSTEGRRKGQESGSIAHIAKGGKRLITTQKGK